jgi:hypothetical protein
MTDQDKNQLLEAIFGDDELAQLRQTSLSRGLQEMRRRRQRAVAARLSMMALPVLLLAAMVLYSRFQPRDQAPAPTTMALASKAASKVEYITADQLFASFPERSMALVGQPGHQQLIFLDQHPASENQ